MRSARYNRRRRNGEKIMTKTRIGIYGVGHNHAAGAIDALKRDERVEIVGIYEPDGETLARRRKECPATYDGIANMTETEFFGANPDAVMVETSVPDLVSAARKCAERGLHIHMDKPAGINLDEYGGLLDLARQKRLIFQTGYMYRYNAGIRYVFDKAKSGALGKIYNVTAQMCTKHPAWLKEQFISYGVKSPIMYIFGCHLIDLVLGLKGEPQKINAFGAVSGDGGVDFTDTSLAVMSYPDGIATVKVSSVEVNGWGMREFTVCGEKGTISVSPIEKTMKVVETLDGESSPWNDGARIVEICEEDRYDPMMREFVSEVRGELPNTTDYEREYLLQKYTLAACGYAVEK